MNPTIGVIGNGFVGSAIVNAFDKSYDVKVFDQNRDRSRNNYGETINQDIVFVCVPTPMSNAEGGECNLSIINNALKSISENNKRNDNLFVIKSTVPIGTTQVLSKSYPQLNIVHSPEFLTARNAMQDFINASRHVIGIPNIDGVDADSLMVSCVERYHSVLKTSFPNSEILVMDSDESEFTKYVCNCFLATKVAFFNEMYSFAEAWGLNWNAAMAGVLADERIGKSHTAVPGPDGDRGFGGTCFPKDINALIRTLESVEVDPLILRAAWEQNKKVRNNWDWAHESSAVLSNKEGTP